MLRDGSRGRLQIGQRESEWCQSEPLRQGEYKHDDASSCFAAELSIMSPAPSIRLLAVLYWEIQSRIGDGISHQRTPSVKAEEPLRISAICWRSKGTKEENLVKTVGYDRIRWCRWIGYARKSGWQTRRQPKHHVQAIAFLPSRQPRKTDYCPNIEDNETGGLLG